MVARVASSEGVNVEAAEPTFDEEMALQLGDLYKDWEGSRASVERYKVLSDSRAGK